MQDLHTKDEFNRQADQRAAERFFASMNLPTDQLREFSLLENQRHEAIRHTMNEQQARFGDDVAKAKQLFNAERNEMHLKPYWANEVDMKVREEATNEQAKNVVNRTNFLELTGIENQYEKAFGELLASQDLYQEEIRQKDEALTQETVFKNFNDRSANGPERRNPGQER
jgi:hypothetical protein